MSRTLSVIGAPSSAGAYAAGQERAPDAWRQHGVLARLEASGRGVRDRGDTQRRRWTPDPGRPDAMNIAGVGATARELADRVAEAVADGDDVLVLGGDCTTQLGAMAGATRREASVALLYVDLDADLKVPATGEGAIDWMGVAHLVDATGAVDELAGLGARRPIVPGSDVRLFAQDNITASEADLVNRHGIAVTTLDEVHQNPGYAADQAVAWASGHDELWVHVDIDVLRWVDFPIAENSRRRDGLALDELGTVLRRVVGAANWRGLTICEVNPDHAPDEAESFARLVAWLGGVFDTDAR
ncbi:arginase family protein [Nocardioides zeae]|uniref:Arginase family protein n=1 Tax=Nocardioides imazamoxiresistens TaxID=3231893 RepID=A0ABU3PZM1_9ACTN|nr:arginase family protein [Nocardioides zeae]MDT9594237.1 arginase family protein [Nocardioides zeae]